LSEKPESSPAHAAPTPESPDSAGMTDEQLAEAKQYGRRDLVCYLADKALDVVYLGVAAFLLAGPIDRWLSGWAWLAQIETLRLVALFLIVTAGHIAVSFPLSFYAGHVLEHRYELSTQTFAAWLWRYVKKMLLAVGFTGAIFVGIYWLIWTTHFYWWLLAAVAFFLVGILIGRLMPVLILPLFYKSEKLDDPELAGRIGRLAEEAGLSIEGVYRLVLSDETVKANAMLAGLGRTRRVLLGDTLLDGFAHDEIEVVFAHEIGHHARRHLWKMLVAGAVISLAGLWICDRLMSAWAAGQQGTLDYAAFPVAALPLLMLILTLFGTLFEPVQNAISRRFERQADRYALEQTQTPDAYCSAFRKLSKLNKDDPNPHWLEVLLFHGHPPISQRLAMAERLSVGPRSS
jgi:STE24 endopeptidase